MWSLVIAKDLFSAFDADDLFDADCRPPLPRRILARGGSRDAADLVADFLGRPYSFDALAPQSAAAWPTSPRCRGDPDDRRIRAPPPPETADASTRRPTSRAPLYERWVERGYFTADPTSDKPPFSLVIPPPNVTGSLHLGHALEQSMMDALTRRARMRGFDVLWLPGMDHASIAVQNLVERHLAETEGKGRFDYTPRGVHRARRGSGRTSTAARSSARCAASATASTGRASASPWTRASSRPSRRSSSGSTTTT